MVGVTWDRMLEPSQEDGGSGWIEPHYEGGGSADVYVETDRSYGEQGARGYGSCSCAGGPEPYR